MANLRTTVQTIAQLVGRQIAAIADATAAAVHSVTDPGKPSLARSPVPVTVRSTIPSRTVTTGRRPGCSQW